ncbi:MAG: efflux RND transporter periplasmic adaptor subunit [Acidobacteria bacterium]|nr:efflux RND transporter periplasmic adaptor subunit [Acidobacteriota bacterium]
MTQHVPLAHCGLILALSLCGCTAMPQAPPPKSAAPPSQVSGPKLRETELATVTLTDSAAARLGIRVAPVTKGRGNQMRRFIAEALLPPGRSLTVTAPVSGILKAATAAPLPGSSVKQNQVLFAITPLLPLPRDLRVTAEADVEQARTRLETAQLRQARADRLLQDQVGTVRAQEDARNELQLASSALAAAQARLQQIKNAPLEGDVTLAVRAPQDGMLRQILANPGQAVNAGAALFEIADLSTFWLRVPIYAGEAAGFNSNRNVRVETLSGAPIGEARPVPAPPTGDPLAATVDFYFEAPAPRHNWKPGERVAVIMLAGAAGQDLLVPYSAVVYDIQGGAWLYEQKEGHRFVRHRVLISHTAAGMAFLSLGPRAGTPVVVEAAAELWGVEFGAGK